MRRLYLKKHIVIFAACLVLAFLAYANSIPNPFIWDDEGLIAGNPSIGNLCGWYKVFTSDLYSHTLAGSNFYRPLQFVSFMLDYHFWYLNPVGYHITNILLHTAVASLVFLFLLEISANMAVSAAAALLFAAHPMHTEVVAYIAGRADMLMAIALLTAFLLFTRSERAAGWRGRFLFAGSLISFSAGLLSKELAVVFPLIIFARVIYYAPGNFVRPWYVLARIVPFFAVSAVYGILRHTALNFTTLWRPELAQHPFWLRVMMLPAVFIAYLKILFFPVGLHMSRTMIRPVTAAEMVLCAAGAVGIIFCAGWLLYALRRRPCAGFLCAWSLIFFLPQSGIFPINAFVAEHFIHLASVSAFFGVAYAARRYLQPRAWWLVVVSVTALLITVTITRNFEWRNPVVFYQGILKYSPDSYRARVNLGVQYDRHGDYELAEREFAEAARIKPERIEAQSNLAITYYNMARYEDSLRVYHIVETIVPADKAAQIQVNIGNVYLAMDDRDKALARYGLALKLDPSMFAAHFNNAMIYRGRRDFQRASEEISASFPAQFRAAAREPVFGRMLLDFIKEPSVDPLGAFWFYTQLGIRAFGSNIKDMSLACMLQAKELDPLSADARFNLALAYMNLGRMREARRELKEALRCAPQHSRAGRLLQELRKQ